jgi:hypothetical protein
MALTDFGYGPELVVQRLHAIITADISATLGTIDTEFEAEWSDGAGTTKVPSANNIHKFGIDTKINWGQTQIFIEAADTQMVNQMYNEQPIQGITATVTVAFQARDAKQASFWQRRYHAALLRIIGSNRGLEPSPTDGLEGITGIGIPRTSARFDRELFRGIVVLTLPNIQTQVYGND